MTTFRPLLPAFFLALLAACSGGASGTITLSSYDTTCQQDSDCVGVSSGAISCCSCDNAAINKSDQATYEADLAAGRSGCGAGYACGVDCVAAIPVCTKGKCAVSNGVGPACGATTCNTGEICVMSQFEGGAQMVPDAGACPTGYHTSSTGCEADPTYLCAPTPAACSAGLTCGCAQSACQSGYTCQTTTATEVDCYLMAP